MDIADTLHGLIDEHVHDCIVCMERYSFASTGLSFSIGEFTGLLKLGFYSKGYMIEDVSPGEWKKKIVGKGNAKKNEIVEYCTGTVLREGLEFVNSANKLKKDYIEDICDSFCICEFNNICTHQI